MLLGSLVNALTIAIGGFVGTVIGRFIPKRHADLIMVSLQIVVLVLGIGFAIKSENILIVIISLVVGSLIGETLDLDKGMKKIGEGIRARLKNDGSDISTAFVTTTLIFCVGSMAILASIESGMKGNHTIHYTKAIIDGISAIFFASTLGIGVALSGASVLIYQGALTLLASVVAPYITPEIMTEVSATGGVLLIALALSMMEIKQIKVANMIPALIIPIILIITGIM